MSSMPGDKIVNPFPADKYCTEKRVMAGSELTQVLSYFSPDRNDNTVRSLELELYI